MSDSTIDILCFLYVTLEVFLGFLLYRYGKWRSEGVRKFIHILTSFIIIPCEMYVKSPWWRVALPFAFIFINLFAVCTNMIKDLGLRDEKRNTGLVLYPVGVTATVALEALSIISSESAIAGVLMLGLGDGMAALIGTRWGKHTFSVYGKSKRSLEGCTAMAMVSVMVVLLFTEMSLPYAIFTGIIVSLIEAFSPSSFDNITIPVLASLVVQFFSGI